MTCIWIYRSVLVAAVILLVLLVIFVVKWRKDETRYALLAVMVTIVGLGLTILSWFLLPGFIDCCDLGSTSLTIKAVEAKEEKNPDADTVGTTTVEVTDGWSRNLESCGLEILLLVRPTADDGADWQVSEPITEIGDTGEWSGQISVRTETIQPATSLEVLGIALSSDDARHAPREVADPAELNPAIESDTEQVMLPPLVAVEEPVSRAEIDATYENGATAVQVSGVSRAVAASEDLHVVVLAKATEPASAGWWAFEAVDPDPDGNWAAQGFIGSAQSPIEEGHRFQVVALATDHDPDDFEPPIESVDTLDPVARSAAVGFSIGAVEGRPRVAITKPEPDATTTPSTTEDETFAVLASSLNVRVSPATTAATVDEVPKGGRVSVVCAGPGDPYKDPSDSWRTRWHRISSPSSGWVAAAFVETGGGDVSDCRCFNPPGAFEAESAAEGKSIQNRGEAFGGFTVHLDNDRMELPLTTCAATRAGLTIRYSNDNYNDSPNESVRLYLDAQVIGQFTAKDTGGGGAGWNTFEESQAIPVELTSGSHSVTIAITGGDGGGVEIDAIRVAAQT